MTAIWDDVKDRLRAALPEKCFSLWISPLSLIEAKGKSLVLGCPNKFSMNWVAENYKNLIEEKLEELGHGDYAFHFKVMPPKKKPSRDIGKGPSQLVLPSLPRPVAYGPRPLNREFTFDRFVVGKCNEFAYSAAKALALEGSLPYNSLFMLSKTGLGKSHLSQATGHEILRNNPKTRVFYITAEEFINEMVYSLKKGKIEEFKDKYRRCCDVLLLEEVHFLSGKEKTQLELAHTLDALLNGHKRILFTSSLLPKDIPSLTKELSSRFTSGIITTLGNPDYETRVKILQRKASEQNLCLTEDILELLARHLTGDVRQMESALQCLKAKSELLKEKITPDLAQEVIKSHIPVKDSTAMEQARNLVCKYFKVDPLILRSKSRKKNHSYPRNVYVYLCRRYTDTTVEEIGKSINRSHSTVVYAYESIERKMKLDQKVKNQVNFLGEKLRDLIK
ncbi:MAG: chromosomal replication initiator protein DnaA [Deltaproteobacteria bacterium]|nr:chromosomal replication initiator protein DnaA [Deltaproteobacteria bacterium]MBW2018145.1 chromosomal replication initiator protein DnaA [Deltaproteobacteria bacterium]MBW2302241.1 chromosomal replication initiator protein DnaA [Deltaproteobacteria bacterium]